MAKIRGTKMRVEGMRELDAQFQRIRKMPKKYLNRAAREGMKDPEREAKAVAPVGKTGTLRRSIKKKMETPNKRNKGVYTPQYNPKFTPLFLKKTTGVYGGRTPHAYYPASVEYGYKGKGGKHIKPKTMYTFKKIIAKHEKSSAKKVVDSLNKSIDELLKKNLAKQK